MPNVGCAYRKNVLNASQMPMQKAVVSSFKTYFVNVCLLQKPMLHCAGRVLVQSPDHNPKNGLCCVNLHMSKEGVLSLIHRYEEINLLLRGQVLYSCRKNRSRDEGMSRGEHRVAATRRITVARACPFRRLISLLVWKTVLSL